MAHLEHLTGPVRCPLLGLSNWDLTKLILLALLVLVKSLSMLILPKLEIFKVFVYPHLLISSDNTTRLIAWMKARNKLFRLRNTTDFSPR